MLQPLERQKQALEALVAHGESHGAVAGIADPVAWQRKQRESSDPWEEIARDSSRS